MYMEKKSTFFARSLKLLVTFPLAARRGNEQDTVLRVADEKRKPESGEAVHIEPE